MQKNERKDVIYSYCIEYGSDFFFKLASKCCNHTHSHAQKHTHTKHTHTIVALALTLDSEVIWNESSFFLSLLHTRLNKHTYAIGK